MPLTLELPDKFYKELQDSMKACYIHAVEEARRDVAITKDYLTIQEAIKLYGVSRNTFTKWTGLGLPFYKVEGKQFYSRKEINSFIKEHQSNEKSLLK